MSIPDIKVLLSTDDGVARTEIITTHLEQMEAALAQTRDTVGACVNCSPRYTLPPTSRCATNQGA